MATPEANGHLLDPDTGERVSIEDMQATPEIHGARLVGTAEQLSFDLGSEYGLNDSTLKLATVPPLAVDGQYREGDRVRVVMEIEVEYVSFPPIKERGFRVGTERRHIGQVLSVAPLDQ